MRKRIFDFVLMAAMTCGLSIVAASCSDKDKELSDEEKEQQAEQQTDQDMADAATFWQVVGQLTDDVMPDDWRNATYEPAIGLPDDADNAVRIVSTADIETAAERFAQLTGAAVTASTTTYTYQNDLVGTLTYRQTGGTSLATVDVDIKQMPGLKQIVYKNAEQIGDGANGSFNGTAYYRFGDVVRKLNVDGLWDYWICVRPAFGPANKGDSHWITLSKLPSPYVKTVNKTVNRVRLTHVMPKSLGTKTEHMQNLAELLYAMTHSETWATNLSTNNGYKRLKYFKDFDYTKIFKYNNDVFFKDVYQTMPNSVFKEIFGLSKQQMAAELEEDGLHLVYNSATMSGNNISLNVAKYSGTNLKTETYYKQTTTHDTEAFDIYAMTKNHYITSVTADQGTFKMWVCRYATGATLAKGSRETPATFDKYRRLPNCEDVFVYNRDVDKLDMENLRNTPPRESKGMNLSDFSGIPHYSHGDILRDQYGHKWVVVYQAGNPDIPDRNIIAEKSPFAELVSFEGITYSSDHKRATNLPTRNQAIRGALWLEQYFYNLAYVSDNTKEELEDRNKMQWWGSSWWNLLENCDVEIRDYFQLVTAQNGDPRQGSVCASIAYNDSTGRQRLLRWVRFNQRNDQNFNWFLSDLYPTKPDNETTFYSDNAYNKNSPIYLDDLADQDMVDRYAEDSYARQGVSNLDNLKNNADTSPRQPRSTTDPRATDVRNYFYDRTAWESRSFPADMWNAPVLMFRMTRVYDRGDEGWSDTTMDGLHLTRIAEHDWGERAEEDIDGFREGIWGSIWNGFCYTNGASSGFWFLNGKTIDFPTWRMAW